MGTYHMEHTAFIICECLVSFKRDQEHVDLVDIHLFELEGWRRKEERERNSRHGRCF